MISKNSLLKSDTLNILGVLNMIMIYDYLMQYSVINTQVMHVRESDIVPLINKFYDYCSVQIVSTDTEDNNKIKLNYTDIHTNDRIYSSVYRETSDITVFRLCSHD